MQRFTLILAIALFATSLSVSVFAADDPTVAANSGPASATEGQELIHPTTALGLTIQNIQQTAQTKVQELSLRLTSAVPGSVEAIGFQRQIAEVKAGAEVAILDAVIQDAIESGDELRQVEAEAARDRLLDPDQYRTPAISSDRPAPSN